MDWNQLKELIEKENLEWILANCNNCLELILVDSEGNCRYIEDLDSKS